MEVTMNMRKKTSFRERKAFRPRSIKLGLFYEQNPEIVKRAIALVLAFVLSNVVTGCCVNARVEKKLTREFQNRLEAEISLARAEITNDVRAAYGADEIDAQTAQFNLEVDLISKLLYPYLVNITDNSLRSGVWCVLCRTVSNGYPDTIEGVVRQRDQWMGFSDNNPVVQRVHDIVSEQLKLYYSGAPFPMDPIFVFANWQNGQMVLRDSFNGTYHIWDDSDWEKLGYK